MFSFLPPFLKLLDIFKILFFCWNEYFIHSSALNLANEGQRFHCRNFLKKEWKKGKKKYDGHEKEYNNKNEKNALLKRTMRYVCRSYKNRIEKSVHFLLENWKKLFLFPNSSLSLVTQRKKSSKLKEIRGSVKKLCYSISEYQHIYGFRNFSIFYITHFYCSITMFLHA